MIVFVDSESKIRAVGKTNDESLKPLYIDETNPMYPFKGWSNAKICCYRVTVQDGIVTMYTPYVDSRLIDSFDQMGKQIDSFEPFEATQSASFNTDEVIFTDVPKGIITVDVESLNDEELPVYHVSRSEDIVKVFFDEPLKYAADVRLIVN